jgi:hypothetical protein
MIKENDMEVTVKLSWARVGLMLVYLVGIGVFAYSSQWAPALLMVSLVYWTNAAWFHEGKGKRLIAMLYEAKELLELRRKEPVSKKENE